MTLLSLGPEGHFWVLLDNEARYTRFDVPLIWKGLEYLFAEVCNI